MSILAGFLLVCGLTLLLLGICWVVLRLQKRFPSKKYDERQMAARGKAFQFAFWVGALYDLVIVAILTYTYGSASEIAAPYLLFFVGYYLRALAAQFYCLLTHSALPLSNNPWASCIGLFCCALIWAAMLLTRRGSHNLTLTGEGSILWVYILAVAAFLAMALMQLAALLRREKE